MKTDKFGILIFILIVVLLLLAASALRAQTTDQSAAPRGELSPGGALSLAKTAIAGGGAEMQNQTRAVQATAGQAVAGGVSTGGGFSLNPGFWTPETLAPTAATVSIGGRVTTAQGSGIRNAQVAVQLPSGEIRTTRTGSFGFYRFNDIEVGAAYVLTVSSRRFVFSQTTQILIVNEERGDINFVGEEN